MQLPQYRDNENTASATALVWQLLESFFSASNLGKRANPLVACLFPEIYNSPSSIQSDLRSWSHPISSSHRVIPWKSERQELNEFAYDASQVGLVLISGDLENAGNYDNLSVIWTDMTSFWKMSSIMTWHHDVRHEQIWKVRMSPSNPIPLWWSQWWVSRRAWHIVWTPL